MSKQTPTLRALIDGAFREAAKPRKLERTVYDGNVKQQHPPYFEVRSKGTMVEYTDNRNDAYDAYFKASLPKEVIRIDVVAGRGFRTVVERMSDIQHRKVA